MNKPLAKIKYAGSIRFTHWQVLLLKQEIVDAQSQTQAKPQGCMNLSVYMFENLEVIISKYTRAERGIDAHEHSIVPYIFQLFRL